MLVDYTFFQGGILDIEGAVLNVDTASETNHAIVDRLQSFVMEYEAEYLEKLLGEKLYMVFSKYLERRKENPEEKWENLIRHLVVKRSEGENEVSRSPIANYIYFYFLRYNHTQATLTGVKADGDDGRLISPERKMIFAWNDMVKMNSKLIGWLRDNRSDYPGLVFDMELLQTINSFGI